MQNISFRLDVLGWSYGRSQRLNWENTTYKTERKMTVRCAFGSLLFIDGRLFRDRVLVHIKIGDPIVFQEPLDLEFFGTHYAITSGLGGAIHSPRHIDSDSGDELRAFVEINLIIPQDLFEELIEARHELDTLYFEVIGEGVYVDFEGEPYWDCSSVENNRLYIIGFDYDAGALNREAGDIEQ